MNTKDELWNKRFSETTRSIAFQLSLSHSQCVMLMNLLQRDKYEKKKDTIVIGPFEFGRPLVALERRGLVEHDGENYNITKAGHLVLALLFLAYDEEELKKMARVTTVTVKDVKIPAALKEMLE